MVTKTCKTDGRNAKLQYLASLQALPWLIVYNVTRPLLYKMSDIHWEGSRILCCYVTPLWHRIVMWWDTIISKDFAASIFTDSQPRRLRLEYS